MGGYARPADELADRVLTGQTTAQLHELVTSLTTDRLGRAVHDLGGHDLPLLVDTFDGADDHRPAVVFAYTIKGRGLASEGHPNNHSALLTEPQMGQLAEACGIDATDPWAHSQPSPIPAGSAPARPRRSPTR